MSSDKRGESLPLSPATGMRDILPQSTLLRDQVTAIILETYRSFGFERVETPALEDIRRLTAGEGGDNEKLIFKVLKRGEKLDLSKQPLSELDLVDLGLRYDLTVPLVRYFAANNSKLPNPFKAIQIGPVWRAERPQRGRYRQFTQCDIDIIGMKSELAEIELIAATAQAILNIGFKKFSIKINDRRILSGLVRRCGFDESQAAAVFVIVDKLDKIGVDGIQKELSEKGFAAEPVKALTGFLNQVAESGAPSLKSVAEFVGSALDAEVVTALDRIVSLSCAHSAGRYDVIFDPTLVRGMGYYTGPIFEISMSEFGGSMGGGGRYDGLVGRSLGREVPACGFSIGFERVLMLLEEGSIAFATAARPKIALFYDPERDDLSKVYSATARLRQSGERVSLYERPKKLHARLNDLSKHGYGSFALFESGAFSVKPITPDEASDKK